MSVSLSVSATGFSPFASSPARRKRSMSVFGHAASCTAGTAKVVKKYDPEKAKEWWSFQAPKKAAVPAVQDAAWPKTDIDRFLLAGLEAKGLKPVADADK